MKISVVMPVYNAEKHLRFSVGSVLNQTYDDWELVCVDDGSADSSGRILDGYAAQDARIRVIHKANGGVSEARNAGMESAAGELVTFLDADDTYVPQALEFLVAVRAKTGADVIRYGCHHVQSHAADVATPELPTCSEIDLEKLDESPLRQCSLGWATVIPAEFVRQVRWPDLTQCEDPLFVLQCLRICRKAVRVDGGLANYLVRPDSLSHAFSLSAITATCRYLPQAYDACIRLPCHSRTREDTCRFVAGFLDGPLDGCWKKLPRSERAEARRAVLRARWEMALKDSFFPVPRQRLAYDLVFSIGCSCSCSQVLRAADLQLLSLPLDWIGDASLGLRTDFLLKGFKGMLSPERLERMAGDENDVRHDHYIDRETRLQYFHDYPKGIDPAVAFPAVRDRFFRRAERLFVLLKRARHVLLVWMGDIRECEKPTADDVRAGLDRFARHYPQTSFDMLVFELPEDGGDGMPQVSYGANWKRIDLDYLDHSAGSEPWVIRKDVILRHLAPYSVREYRTAAEKRVFRRKLREYEMRRLAASGRWDFILRKARYRLFRHLEKDLTRKGVLLDESL